MRLILSTSLPRSKFAACLTITMNILNSQTIEIFRKLQRIPDKDECTNEDVVWCDCDCENCGGLGERGVKWWVGVRGGAMLFSGLISHIDSYHLYFQCLPYFCVSV